MVVMAQPWKHPKTGIYYIRRHIPADVREKFGTTVYKRTLGTKSPSEARRLFAIASAELDEAITLARSGFKLTSVNAKALAGEWLRAAVDEDEQDRSVDDREAMIDEAAGVSGYALQYEAMERAAGVGRSRPARMRKAVAEEVVGILRAKGIALAEGSEDYQRLADEIFWAKVRLLSIKDRREQGDWAKPAGLDDYPRFFAPKGETKRPAKKTSGVAEGDLLSAVFGAYKTEKKLPPKTVKEADKAIRRFTELQGDVFVVEITHKMVREFKEALRKLPKRQPPSIRGKKTLPEVLALIGDNPPEDTISDGSINKDIGCLSAVLTWAKGQGHFDDVHNWMNPALGLKIKENRWNEEDRLPYSLEDLKTIFSMPVFLSGERPEGGRGEAAKWLPLMALLSGARLTELGQLLVSDIDVEKDIWYLDINLKGEGKRVKNKASIRKIPLHPELIACGFLGYVEDRRKAGDVRLFPALEPDKLGNITGSWSKWWGRYARENGVPDRRKVFHSFRHTFKTVWRDCELDEAVGDRVTGHAPATEGRKYGKGGMTKASSLASMNSRLKELRFEGLDLSHLHVLGVVGQTV